MGCDKFGRSLEKFLASGRVLASSIACVGELRGATGAVHKRERVAVNAVRLAYQFFEIFTHWSSLSAKSQSWDSVG